MKKYILITLFLSFTLKAKSQSFEPTFAQLDELFQGTFGYLAAAKSCHDNSSYEVASNAIVRIINYANYQKFEIKSIKLFISNPDDMINLGVTMYEKQKRVSCNQVKKYVETIDDVTKRLP